MILHFPSAWQHHPAPRHLPRAHAALDEFEIGEREDVGDRAGVQVGAIDALLAQLCIRHKLTLLTTDNDFVRAASRRPLRVWGQDR